MGSCGRSGPPSGFCCVGRAGESGAGWRRRGSGSTAGEVVDEFLISPVRIVLANLSVQASYASPLWWLSVPCSAGVPGYTRAGAVRL